MTQTQRERPASTPSALHIPQQGQRNAGAVLAATDAMRWRRGGLWTDAEVAYLVHLAYETGRVHGYAEDMAETVATWQEHAQPRPTREQRIAARLAEMPPPTPQRYDDPDWPPVTVPGAGGVRLGPGQIIAPGTPEPPEPPRGWTRFPTLEEQSAWLSSEDVAFCRSYARERYR